MEVAVDMRKPLLLSPHCRPRSVSRFHLEEPEEPPLPALWAIQEMAPIRPHSEPCFRLLEVAADRGVPRQRLLVAEAVQVINLAELPDRVELAVEVVLGVALRVDPGQVLRRLLCSPVVEAVQEGLAEHWGPMAVIPASAAPAAARAVE